MPRPTKLSKTLIAKASQFFGDRRDDKMLLPTVEGLALELGISRDTVYDWCDIPEEADAETRKLKEQFSDIVSDLKSAQAEKLVQLGLSGRYNSAIAKLILSGKHGYVEKKETDITSGGESLGPVLVKFVGDTPEE